MNKMCKAKLYKSGKPNSRIDKCMRDCIHTLDAMSWKIKTVACCCGHGKYPMTIVVENLEGTHWELLSGIMIYRKRKFYKRNKQGYYFIPECETR